MNICMLLAGYDFPPDIRVEKEARALMMYAFANNVLQLHKKLTANKDIEIKKQHGGYSGNPDFYLEEAFYDKKTGMLISKVQWEKNTADLMHTIEVFIYDDKGRITRDYAAAYLPSYRNAPTQTLVSLHNYNGKLHAFRSFDASGYLVVQK